MALTDLKVSKTKAADRAQKLGDGDGLYLYISVSGTKSWRLDYTFGGKRYTYTIGQYPITTLAEARIKRSELKKSLMDGINPSLEKRKIKIQRRASVEDTFAAVAQDWFNSKSDRRSKAWYDANSLYLRRDLNPDIGPIPINEIDGKTLLAVLESVAATRGLRTADRVRQTALQVFEHAMLKFKTDRNPASMLKRWAEIPARVNRPHLEEKEIQGLIDAMDVNQRPILSTSQRPILSTFSVC